VEHEASTLKIGVGAEAAVSMIINGFCRDVFQQLPMEFAVEAKHEHPGFFKGTVVEKAVTDELGSSAAA
jgi:hypothetical protein